LKNQSDHQHCTSWLKATTAKPRFWNHSITNCSLVKNWNVTFIRSSWRLTLSAHSLWSSPDTSNDPTYYINRVQIIHTAVLCKSSHKIVHTY